MDYGIGGRTAIVCAASQGLGKGCAMALANEGVNVNAKGNIAAAVDFNAWKDARTIAELPDKVAKLRDGDLACAERLKNEQALRSAENWINERRILWEHRLDRLGAYLEANPDMPENPGKTEKE